MRAGIFFVNMVLGGVPACAKAGKEQPSIAWRYLSSKTGDFSALTILKW